MASLTPPAGPGRGSARPDRLGGGVQAADKICAYLTCVEEPRAGNAEFRRAEEALGSPTS